MEFEELKYENKDDLNEIADPSELEDFQKECIYTPLSLVNPTPYEPSNEDYIMREHDGNADEDWDEKNNLVNDVPIERDSLIGFGIHKRKPKLLICITMYNEPPKQLVESLAGIYRSYYELIDLDPTFLNRVHIVIVSDGYGPLMEKPEHLKCYDKANIHDIKKLSEKNYTTNVFKAGFEDTKTVFNRLLFINSENMISREDKRGQQEEEYKDEEEKLEARRRSSMKGNSGPKKKYRDIRAYGANNIGHCFSRAMHFQDWEQCLPREQRDFLVVDNYEIYDFLVGSDEQGRVKDRKYEHFSLPIHFIVKHNNQGKIESHKWFFKGFCRMMDPIYAQIIDCGSIPLWNSISKIIMHMETFTDVGGACGEIECILAEKKEDGIEPVTFVESVLLRAQYVEYKVSHYMDKATESLFGFVSVLPGAFSTFRWECINGKPLSEFLKGCKDEFGDVTKIMPCDTANKYLAEDRIMCLEIIAKAHASFIIHYIPGAKCLTDPPLSLTQLVKQRRRWFNGSLFATLHVMKSMYRIWARKWTSFFRNIFYMILYAYMILLLILSYLIVGLFYSAFSIFIRAVLESDNCLNVARLSNILENVYLIFLFFCLMLSTTVQVNYAETGFRLCSLVMGLFTIVMIFCSVYYAIDDTQNRNAVILIGIFILSYMVPLILNISHLKLADFLKGIFYALYLSPTYANIFTIFAISNIHDVSWGSRPGGASKDKNIDVAIRKAAAQKEEAYKDYRANFLIVWLCANAAVGGLVTYWSRNGQNDFLLWLGVLLSAVVAFKLILSTIHKLVSYMHNFFIWIHVRGLAKRLKRQNIESFHNHVRHTEKEDHEIVFEKFRDKNAIDQEEEEANKNRLDEKILSFQNLLQKSIAADKLDMELDRFKRSVIASLGGGVQTQLNEKIQEIAAKKQEEQDSYDPLDDEESDEELDPKSNKDKKGFLGKILSRDKSKDSEGGKEKFEEIPEETNEEESKMLPANDDSDESQSSVEVKPNAMKRDQAEDSSEEDPVSDSSNEFDSRPGSDSF